MARLLPALAAFLAFVLLHAIGGECAVHTYTGDYFYVVGDALIFRGGREGMWKSHGNAVDHYGLVSKGIADGKSYIRFSQVTFTRPNEAAAQFAPNEGDTGIVQAVIFEVVDRDLIGYPSPDGKGRKYCCSPDLVAKTRCTPGRLIVLQRPGGTGPGNEGAGGGADGKEWPWTMEVYFTGNATTVRAPDRTLTVPERGMYFMWFVACDSALSGSTVSGMTTWKNPSGYLPGMMAGMMPFFAVMSIAYITLGVLWLGFCAAYWREVLPLQFYITAVISLGMVEIALWCFDYVNFNSTGYRPYWTTVWAVLMGSCRKTLGRMLLLVVSMGYGVVRPTLGGLTRTVLLLGAAYLGAAVSLDVAINVGTIDDLTSSARMFLVLPVAVLDSVFIMWTFTSLAKTLSQLQARRQAAKTTLYNGFARLLVGAVLASTAWVGFELYFKLSDEFNERWEQDWTLAAFWHVLTWVVTAGVCLLWRPSDNATQYAYSVDSSDHIDLDDDEDDRAPLVGGAGMSAATAAKRGHGGGGADRGAPGASPAFKTDVFTLDDGGEEPGKLE